MRFRFIVLSKGKPGREAEFADWYANTHVGEVVALPGVLSGQFFECAMIRKDGAGHGFTHMAEYECEADSPQVIADELNARQASGRMKMTDAIDPGNLAYFFTPVTGRITK